MDCAVRKASSAARNLTQVEDATEVIISRVKITVYFMVYVNVYISVCLLHAVTPMDYGAVSTIMTFTACETRRCVDITIVNDTEGEPDETFGITLARTPGLNGKITLDPMDEVITISSDSGMSYLLLAKCECFCLFCST